MTKDTEFNFDKMLVQVSEKLEQYSHRYQLPEDDRKDLVSETILRILTRKDYFMVRTDSLKDFTNWCSRIMFNLFINNYHSQKRNPISSIDELENPDSSLSLSSNFNSDSNVVFSDLSEYVFNKIPNKINKTILRAFLQGYQYEEIAEIMELPVGTVKSKLFLIRKSLKKHLTNENCKN